MDSELREFLTSRERELVQQIAGLKGQITTREAELKDIRAAKEAIGMASTTEVEASQFNEADTFFSPTVSQSPPKSGAAGILGAISAAKRFRRDFVEAAEAYPFLEFEHMTLKELAIKALTEHFKGGATTAELCEFFRNAYGREVPTSSLSPQLSRLKAGHIVRQDGDVWSLATELAAYALLPKEEDEDAKTEE